MPPKDKHPLCGNGVVDPGEDCDSSRHPPSSRLDSRTGLCCDPQTCKFRPTTYLCRPKRFPESACEVPEFCTGKSSECPLDKHQPDGLICDKIEGPLVEFDKVEKKTMTYPRPTAYRYSWGLGTTTGTTTGKVKTKRAGQSMTVSVGSSEIRGPRGEAALGRCFEGVCRETLFYPEQYSTETTSSWRSTFTSTGPSKSVATATATPLAGSNSTISGPDMSVTEPARTMIIAATTTAIIGTVVLSAIFLFLFRRHRKKKQELEVDWDVNRADSKRASRISSIWNKSFGKGEKTPRVHVVELPGSGVIEQLDDTEVTVRRFELEGDYGLLDPTAERYDEVVEVERMKGQRGSEAEKLNSVADSGEERLVVVETDFERGTRETEEVTYEMDTNISYGAGVEARKTGGLDVIYEMDATDPVTQYP